MRRYGFAIGSVLVLAGVAMHFPDYVKARHDHFMMAGMPMGGVMTTGMALIVAGLALAVWGLLPDRAERAARARRVPATQRYAALDRAELSPAHRLLAIVLFVGLVIDTMKPASLGFTAPGMVKEYGLDHSEIATLPFVAITGTVVGSLLWGYLADIFGRRSTILFSGLMYVATSICGFMPSFGWNLAMCFAMGAAAGGMLPIAYSLMSESIPARQRGWLMVLQSGLATALGYLIASGATSLLVPHLSWRVLWLLGAPTGLLLVVLTRWIPESPRFLLACGREDEAAEVMRRYGVRAVPAEPAPVADAPPPRPATLLTGSLLPRTAGILVYGLGWGVVNWGFITFLPVFLQAAGAGTQASDLLLLASVFALPATAVAAVAYARWSSRRAMLTYALVTGLVLLLFGTLDPSRPGHGVLLVALVSLLLSGAAGMIAMLAPYAAEVYPTTMRATGSGVAAASSKVGGMFGPLLLTTAPRVGTLAFVSAVPVAAAAYALWRTGVETAGRPLVEVIASSEQEG
ncbi:MFS transporter [Actinoallomurus sp. CA-142502]|uniref:MFS transporter n=1 Tax=Actinoallomurus sp. CA-142502 TaxID=3239885 RepID=UPI003D94A6F2